MRSSRGAQVALAWVAFLIVAAPAAWSQAPYPLVDGEIAVTCFSGFNVPFDPSSGINTAGFVAAVMDTRIPPVSPTPTPVPGTNWPVQAFHNEFTPSTAG